jgi:hypothetical protein
MVASRNQEIFLFHVTALQKRAGPPVSEVLLFLMRYGKRIVSKPFFALTGCSQAQ